MTHETAASTETTATTAALRMALQARLRAEDIAAVIDALAEEVEEMAGYVAAIELHALLLGDEAPDQPVPDMEKMRKAARGIGACVRAAERAICEVEDLADRSGDLDAAMTAVATHIGDIGALAEAIEDDDETPTQRVFSQAAGHLRPLLGDVRTSLGRAEELVREARLP